MDEEKAREELAAGNFGVTVALMSVPGPLIVKLHEVVLERGEALWVRFRAWREAQSDKGGVQPFKKWVGATIISALLK